jgi:colanic acid/amylovoran biosynthesis glycosyltransferase
MAKAQGQIALAIAVESLATASETFIHDHIRHLAPGATVLICRDDLGADRFRCPVVRIQGRELAPQTLLAKAVHPLLRRLVNYIDPVRGYLCDSLYSPTDREESLRLGYFLKQHQPVSVLAEYGPIGLQVADACALAGVPFFVHFHGWDANILGQSWSIRRDYRALFKRVAGVIVTTEFLKDRLLHLHCPAQKLFVCPCGVDTNLFRPAESEKAGNVLMVSRLIPQKGPEYSLASFARFGKLVSNIALEIIGDGPLRNLLEEQAREYGIADRVVFHGARDHDFVRQRLSSAAMFIQHSVTLPLGGIESQGLAILEAMASSVPVVATRHGAIVETVEDGVTGLLVAERDIVGMAGAMHRLMEHTDQRLTLGAAGRKRVITHYRQEDTIRRLQSILGLGALGRFGEPVSN